MSRTHAMHALRQLAAEHAAARRLRIPVAEVRGSACRELLGRATAIGLGTALGTALGAGLTGRTATAQALTRGAAPTVAVVGADIAGLTAALTLKDAGVNCTLYESNPGRVGGQIWTQRDHWALEHVFARMKTWKILRECPLKGDGVHYAMLGIARMHKLALAG
ncbi:hypothetical protein GCM10018966_072920 [Streptomyces yanii]